MKRITVFGGSKPGEADYEQALHLGKLLGQAGYTVITGGYYGTMEAVSRGAAENGAHVIGITVGEMEAKRNVRANAWVQKEMSYPTLRQRLFALIEECDAALALPGGPGTLAEIAEMWNHILTGSISPRPLILIGAGWQAVFETLFREFGGYMPEEPRRWLQYAANIDEAVDHLKAWSSGPAH